MIKVVMATPENPDCGEASRSKDYIYHPEVRGPKNGLRMHAGKYEIRQYPAGYYLCWVHNPEPDKPAWHMEFGEDIEVEGQLYIVDYGSTRAGWYISDKVALKRGRIAPKPGH
ncbi:hypothetical protein GCM10010151_23540 [Actinoallomurus spadix]|uniref:Uncharacterized protein n=1 Tax=Actinoallomurus spadix TaxID=79912 RepID=A0ABP3G1S9_9ACTN